MVTSNLFFDLREIYCCNFLFIFSNSKVIFLSYIFLLLFFPIVKTFALEVIFFCFDLFNTHPGFCRFCFLWGFFVCLVGFFLGGGLQTFQGPLHHCSCFYLLIVFILVHRLDSLV